MAKKQVKIRYLKAEFVSSSLQQLPSSLSKVIIQAFSSDRFNSVEKRLKPENDLGSSYLLIPQYNSTSTSEIWGSIIELSDLKSPILSGKNLKDPQVNIDELFQEVDGDGQGNQSIKNLCHFLIKGNDVILQSVRSITPRDVSGYFNWIIEQHLKTDTGIVFRATIKEATHVTKQIKEIQIADFEKIPISSRQGQSRSISRSGQASFGEDNRPITKKNIIQSILSLIREEGDLPDYIPDEMIQVSLKLKVNQRAYQKHKDEDKVREALEANLRHISEHVVVTMQDGSKLRADSLQHSRIVQIEHTPANYPNISDLLTSMRVFLQEVKNGVSN